MSVGQLVLIIHVAAAVLLIGPPAVAASMFPAQVPLADGEVPRRDKPRSYEAASILHRICRVYGVLALLVPAAGIVLAILWDKFSEPWLIVAMALTAAAGVLFAVRVLPGQAAALASPPTKRAVGALGSTAGLYNLLWFAVAVLMVLQPGSAR